MFAKRAGITLIHCMAHARRMFNEAMDNDEARASHAMQEIQKLYAIERRCRDTLLSADEIREVRQRESVPVLTQLGSWMKEQYVQTLPKSAIGKALGYSIERWERLSEYINDGRLHIDNNPVENSIRPVALGEKIIYSPAVTKQRNEAVCCTRCLVPVRCMVSNRTPG